jgi:LacI family transcriptional regulator
MNRQVTIYDIADAADVSASTVSRALRKEPTIARETRKRIQAKAEELGYRYNPFATSLRTSRTKNIGVIVPKVDNHYMASAVAGIEKVISSEGYNLFLVQSTGCEHKEKAAVDNMYRARVDGLIIFGLKNSSDENISSLFSRKQTPVIAVDSLAQEHVQSVSIDNYNAAYEMTTYLWQMGCRSIAHVTPNLHNPPYSERFRGYRDAIRDKSATENQQLIIVNDKCETTSDVVGTILEMKPFPDAIFFASDVSALLAMPILKSHGIKIPDDVCIAGFGNHPAGRIIEPQLTTIGFSAEEIGESAARSLLNTIDSPQLLFSKQLVSHELIVRKSSGGFNPHAVK